MLSYSTHRAVILRIFTTLFFLFLFISFVQSNRAEAGNGKQVLAFYYSWYDQSSFGYGKTVFNPPTPYLSADTNTIRRHVQQAQGAGIDGFVQSWYGPETVNNQTETNFAELLNIAAQSGFKAGVDFEVGSPFFHNSNDARAQALKTLLATHANHSAYLRMDGKPVIFFWANWILTVDEWQYIRNIADPYNTSIWIGEGGHANYLSVFDGLNIYNVAWAADVAAVQSRWASEARSRGGYWVGTAMPGFDERHLGRAERTYRDRQNGEFYRESFRGAAATNPDILIINSFNEWPEASHIEPSLEFGNYYLDITRQLISDYKGGVIAAPVPQPVQKQAEPAQVAAIEEAQPQQEKVVEAAPLPTETPLPPPPTATAIPPTPVPPTATALPQPTIEPVTQTQVLAALPQSAEPLPTITPAIVSQFGSEPTPTPEPDGRIIHYIGAGESLYYLSDIYGVSLEDLLILNPNISEESVLVLGQGILLGTAQQPPTPESLQPQALEQNNNYEGATVIDGNVIHYVTFGDTLFTIAEQYDIALSNLYEISGLDENSILQLDQPVIVGFDLAPSVDIDFLQTPEPTPLPAVVEPEPLPTAVPPTQAPVLQPLPSPTSEFEVVAIPTTSAVIVPEQQVDQLEQQIEPASPSDATAQSVPEAIQAGFRISDLIPFCVSTIFLLLLAVGLYIYLGNLRGTSKRYRDNFIS